MSLAVVYSRAQEGVTAPLVTVEVHIANGLPSMSIVGLPEAAVKESKDRVKAAIQNARFKFPNGKVTVNLAPADLPKEGGRFDLPIAIGVLAAYEQIPTERLAGLELVGELALTGELRPVRGALSVAVRAAEAERELVVPRTNAPEAAMVQSATVRGADDLLGVCAFLRDGEGLEPQPATREAPAPAALPDLADVRGQHHARRALEVAAAGGHNLLMVGPPGTGKTMLASRMPGILPPLTEREALETAAVLSVAQPGFDAGQWRRRPYRAPHHTASAVALVGGGSPPRPGEISLGHNGVLFLDELPEFARRVLESLREPLESGWVTISRAAHQCEFPARFQLVAAMNPCPCGYLGDSSGRCRCTDDQVRRYRARVSGPLLDRIDVQVEVPRVAQSQLSASEPGEPSAGVRARVETARARQYARGDILNARMGHAGLQAHCRLSAGDRELLENAIERLGLSARAHDRILKLARTIADLDGSDTIATAHLTEAIGYRRLDRA